MNIYKAIRLFGKIKSKRLKIAGLMAMHLLGKRYVGVFLDPVMACNLRCRMCYMSDSNKIKEFRGRKPMTMGDVGVLARSMFHRAMKLQIGCATEPTLSPLLEDIVACGKKYGVPYISITTNGQLLTGERVERLIAVGLSELTLSIHGLRKDTYEYLMNGADFGRFEKLIDGLKVIKRKHPDFKVRLNYVVNSMNRHDLADFFTGVLAGLDFDIVQIRPFQNLGDTSYSDHDLNGVIADYRKLILPIVERCAAEGRRCLAPDIDNLHSVNSLTDGFNDYVEQLTYYYVGPADAGIEGVNLSVNKSGYLPDKLTFEQYHRANGTVKEMLHRVVSPNGGKDSVDVKTTKKLNYNVK